MSNKADEALTQEEVAWQALSFSSNGYILDRCFSDLEEKKMVTALKFEASYSRFFPFIRATEHSQLPCTDYYRYQKSTIFE